MAKTDSSNRWQRPNGQIQGIIVYCSLKNGGIAIISPAVKKDRWIVQVAKTDSSNRWQKPNGQIQGITAISQLK